MMLRDVAGRFGLCQMVRSLHRVARAAAGEPEVYRTEYATGDSDEALGKEACATTLSKIWDSFSGR